MLCKVSSLFLSKIGKTCEKVSDYHLFVLNNKEHDRLDVKPTKNDYPLRKEIKERLIIKKMDIQKKKKILLRSTLSSLALLLMVFLFAGCSYQETNRELVENDFRIVRAGMAAKRIKKELGKPDRIIKDKEKIEALESDDLEASDRWVEEDPSIYTKFYGNEKKMNDYYSLSKENGYSACFEYDYKYDDKSSEIEKWHIYFIDDKVAWMSFP